MSASGRSAAITSFTPAVMTGRGDGIGDLGVKVV